MVWNGMKCSWQCFDFVHDKFIKGLDNSYDVVAVATIWIQSSEIVFIN